MKKVKITFEMTVDDDISEDRFKKQLLFFLDHGCRNVENLTIEDVK